MSELHSGGDLNHKHPKRRMGRQIYPSLFAFATVALGGFCAASCSEGPFSAAPTDTRPRVIISTDVPPLDVIPGGLGYGPPEKRSDPDDLQSFVRLLMYSNDIKIEGLVASAGTFVNVANKQNLLDMLAIYDQVDDRLRRHDQSYPTAAALRAISYQGRSESWGKPWSEIIGEGRNSEASDAIIATVDSSPQPIWFLSWGGSREFAQAIWRVKHERSASDLSTFLAKIRVYLIGHQDGTAGWLEDNFPELFIITSDKSYLGMAFGGDETLSNGAWLEANVRNGFGPLGASYPRAAWSGIPGMQEGDTPSFLYVISTVIGLSDFNDPTMGGWGGRFVASAPGAKHFVDAPEGGAANFKWRAGFQNDFAARMEMCVRPVGQVNRPPLIVVENDGTRAILRREVSSGGALRLSADGTSDPESKVLSFRWSFYSEASSPGVSVHIDDAHAATASITVNGRRGDIAHIVLEVSDSGIPILTSYRRIAIKVN